MVADDDPAAVVGAHDLRRSSDVVRDGLQIRSVYFHSAVHRRQLVESGAALLFFWRRLLGTSPTVAGGRPHTTLQLRSILIDGKMDVSTTKMCLDTSILPSSNMNRREYKE